MLSSPSRVEALGLRLRPVAAAFTLIEIMIVVAIMGIVMTMGVPLVYKVFHRAPMAKAITDVVEVCSHARAQAILQGRVVEVIARPLSKRFDVAGGSAPANHAKEGGDYFEASAAPAPAGSGLSAQISDHIMIEMLDVNLTEYKDADMARIRFFPNGTCDEFTLILHSDTGEFRKIWLEVTTGLANVGDVR